MWFWKTKKQKQQEMWDILSGKPDPDAMGKMIDAIESGDTETTERIFKQMVDAKIREYERDDSKI